jgi:hypothetical protein
VPTPIHRWKRLRLREEDRRRGFALSPARGHCFVPEQCGKVRNGEGWLR